MPKEIISSIITRQKQICLVIYCLAEKKGGRAMIYLIRHGQTMLNEQGRLQGRKGCPLNQLGVEQANKLKEMLNDVKFDYVFSSPQERAIETAKIVTGQMPRIDKRLDVFDVGSADGLIKTEVEYDGLFPNPTIYSGVENPKDYLMRVFAFLNSIKQDENSKDKSILVCGHKCTSFAFAYYFRGMPKDGYANFYLKNGEVAIYSFDNKKEIKREDEKIK